ncbi:MAG: flagellar motor stator protein MotA [Nitrospinae bacterium CG11_big_fil_rev_8_21_14_0_20_56_8]|nr:MAG: flagellar motor stator protein MotA [Nitrospinae bacterium CG11_big_fil_rev_8_21_14_0_20_56_8]
MGVLAGFFIVVASVVIGYVMEHGNFEVLWQPAELVIIFGAALGVFVVTSSQQVIKNVIHSVKAMLSSRQYTENDYVELLQVMNGIFTVVKKQGLVALEPHLDNPQKSQLFSRFKNFMSKKHALYLTTDTFRMIVSSKLAPYQLEGLMESEIESFHEEMMSSSKNLGNVADSLPGLGIVAAVLGVVITMQKISEPPEVLGHSIGAALVGTFLGILGAYGFMGPVAKKLEWMAEQEKEYLDVIKTVIVAFVGGLQSQICLEFGRLRIPEVCRPNFLKMEKLLKGSKD